jgi:archaemetzincin
MTADVHLWWIGADAADDALLEGVRRQVEAVYHLRARRYSNPDRPVHAFDARRGQHSSTQILRWLVERDHPVGRVVAITDADLFIPVLTYVYGEAQLGSRAAVVSTARLSADLTAATDATVRLARAVKETVHELGHTFGLLHCPSPACVMARSVNLVQVDAKDVALCHDCQIRYAEIRKQGYEHHEQRTDTDSHRR